MSIRKRTLALLAAIPLGLGALVLAAPPSGAGAPDCNNDNEGCDPCYFTYIVGALELDECEETEETTTTTTSTSTTSTTTTTVIELIPPVSVAAETTTSLAPAPAPAPDPAPAPAVRGTQAQVSVTG